MNLFGRICLSLFGIFLSFSVSCVYGQFESGAGSSNESQFRSYRIKGDSLLAASKYHEARNFYLSALKIRDDSYISSRLAKCNDEIYKEYLSEADLLLKKSEFDGAIEKYESARKYTDNDFQLANLISVASAKKRDFEISELENIGDVNFRQRRFEAAEENFKKILELDPKNSKANEMMLKISAAQEVMRKRQSEIFTYSKINQDDYSAVDDELADLVNKQIRPASEGFYDLKYEIRFDTLGKNLSSIRVLTSNLNQLEISVENFFRVKVLPPSLVNGINVSSFDNIIQSARWYSKTASFDSRRNSIKGSSGCDACDNEIKRFITAQPTQYGKFDFDIKEKVTGTKKYYDVSMLNYKTAGPSSFLYSMILPGWGTKKVSYGERGTGRMIFFLLSAGLSAGSYFMYKNSYDKYLNTTTAAEIDKYYSQSNNYNRIFLISGGIAASIYVYDIIWVISRGSRNLSQSKQLRTSLPKGGIPVSQNPIKF